MSSADVVPEAASDSDGDAAFACDEIKRDVPELASQPPAPATPGPRKPAPLDTHAAVTPAHRTAFEGRPPKLARYS